MKNGDVIVDKQAINKFNLNGFNVKASAAQPVPVVRPVLRKYSRRANSR